jgi:predicted transposase/invertase (TIGR01784 family)
MENSSEENAKSATIKKIHHMTKRVKGNEEVSIEYMKIYERERMIKEQGYDEGIEVGRLEGRLEGIEAEKERTIASARLLFENGVNFKIVRASISLLSDEELQKIYEEVKKSIQTS